MAKLTDFESSCIGNSEDDEVQLRRTLPWDAPEWHHRWFTLQDAKRQDIFSFGLVCLFFFFQPLVGETQSCTFSNSILIRILSEMDIVEALPELKSKKALSVFADSALAMFFDVSSSQRESLSRFFKSTLALEPEKRELDLQNLIRLLTFDESFVLLDKKERAESGKTSVFPNPHMVASVGKPSH